MRCFNAAASSCPTQLTPLASTSAFVFFQYLSVGFGSRVLVGCRKELCFGLCKTLFHVSQCSMALSTGEFTLAPMSDTAVLEPVDMALGHHRMCFASVIPWLWLLLPGVKPPELNIPNIIFLGGDLDCVLACYMLSSNPVPSVCWTTGDNFSRDGADLDETHW